jgi:hypothetical protein
MRATTVLLVAALAAVVLAHKSVKTLKPATELEREAHDAIHRAQPERDIDDEFVPEEHHRSKSYHHSFGPEYPDNSGVMEYHYEEPRFDAEGNEIPGFVHSGIDPDTEMPAEQQYMEADESFVAAEAADGVEEAAEIGQADEE